MKKKVLILFVVLAVILVASIPAAASGQSYSFLVMGAGNNLPKGLEQKIAAAGGTVEYTIPQIGIAVVTSSNPDFASSKIAGISGIARNLTMNFISPVDNVALEEYANPPFSGDDDFFFDLQWGHDAVDAPEAWNAGYRGAGVRVAILDTGFDLDHPDLAPNINLALSKDFTGEGLEYSLPDPFSHGTHTAGTVGAADNGFGTIGIAPEVELVLLKVLGDEGSGDFAWMIEAIVYAADNDVDVANMSLGAYLPKSGFCDDDGCVSAREIAELKNAIGRAANYATQKGTLLIASAGNDAADGDHDTDWEHFPSGVEHILSISATAPFGWALDPENTFLSDPASYTNFGQSEVDFAAPGGDYMYAYVDPTEQCTVAGLTRPCYVFDYVFSTGNDGWFWSVGTSMASPHAVGVAALIIDANGGDMKPAQVISQMAKLALDLYKPGNDDFYGAGLVQAPTE